LLFAIGFMVLVVVLELQLSEFPRPWDGFDKRCDRAFERKKDVGRSHLGRFCEVLLVLGCFGFIWEVLVLSGRFCFSYLF